MDRACHSYCRRLEARNVGQFTALPAVDLASYCFRDLPQRWKPHALPLLRFRFLGLWQKREQLMEELTRLPNLASEILLFRADFLPCCRHLLPQLSWRAPVQEAHHTESF